MQRWNRSQNEGFFEKRAGRTAAANVAYTALIGFFRRKNPHEAEAASDHRFSQTTSM
jgi:hypothetical protein